MALNIPRFNRIINLTFYDAADHEVLKIETPAHGRKPSIEINGNFYANDTLGPFNVTVKNLYITLLGKQYSKIKVEAGYENNTVTFEGTILTMYQDEPGPESKMTIQCQNGKLQNWLNTTVQLDYEAGTTLKKVLEDISSKLQTDGVHMGTQAATFTLPERLMFDGTARGAMTHIEKLFRAYNLIVYVRNNMLVAICTPGGDFVQAHVLEYISAPPQENSGDESGTFYTTVTAPWEPKLQIGDLLTIPSKVYIRNFVTVGGLSKTQNIQVTSLEFHFATTGGANSMKVQGFIKR